MDRRALAMLRCPVRGSALWRCRGRSPKLTHTDPPDPPTPHNPRWNSEPTDDHPLPDRRGVCPDQGFGEPTAACANSRLRAPDVVTGGRQHQDHCGRRVGVHSPSRRGLGRHQTARPRGDHAGRYELRGTRRQLRAQCGTAADLRLFVLKSGRYAWRLDQLDRRGRPVLPDAWRVAPEVAAGTGRLPDGGPGAGSGRT